MLNSPFLVLSASLWWQDRALDHAAELFEAGDKDKNGYMDCEEIMDIMRVVSIRLWP